jgi:hypothetical protein
VVNQSSGQTPKDTEDTKNEPAKASVAAQTRRKLSYLIGAALLLAVGFIAFDNFGSGVPGEAGPAGQDASGSLDALAERYVKLVLAVGQHDAGYVDAYYGPGAWAAEAEAAGTGRQLVELKSEAEALGASIAELDLTAAEALVQARATFLAKQLIAVAARIAMLQGESMTFDEETQALYDAVSPGASEEELDAVLAELDALIPGQGPLAERYVAFRNQFVIPPGRLDDVFQAAIAACRKRTKRYLELPEGESFTTAYVTDKSWSAYNWYKGDAFSLIEVNTDLPIFINRAVDLGCHEGYPGHHVFNALLEHRFVRELGWVEYSIYPLYSPQSLLAEGTANYGIQMAFPGDERINFERDVLYPMAGIDPALAPELEKAQKLLRKMRYARTEGARRYLDGEISREEAIEWVARYGLVSKARAEQRTRFTEEYRGYVINYTLGADLARAYVERNAGEDAASRWAAYEVLLSTPLTASALAKID